MKLIYHKFHSKNRNFDKRSCNKRCNTKQLEVTHSIGLERKNKLEIGQ